MTTYNRLLKIEMDSSTAPDCRRVMRDERQTLHTRLERLRSLRQIAKHSAVSSSAMLAATESVRAAEAESERVIAMWS